MKLPNQIEKDFIVLGPSKVASIENSDATLYERLDANYDNFIGHELISCYEFEHDWSSWEVHPNGDEIDLGGPVFGLKKGIDMGLVRGPRIWPAGAMISQSGGHGDFRPPNELPAGPDSFPYMERIGVAEIADSPDLVRQRSREQLALGASQLKLMAGGGVSSQYDPLDVTQYTVPELRAAVEAAENWGTYVTVHAYTPRAVRQAIEAGVKCIDRSYSAPS